MTHYERNSPVAQQNAKAIEEFLLAEQAKGSEGCSRMEIEIATGLLHNQWDKAREQLGDRLVGFGSVPKLFKYKIKVRTMNTTEIKQEFDKNAARFVDGVVVAKGAITGVLNQACGGDDNRHLVLKALTGSTSSRSMSEAQWFALLQFVQPYKPEGQRWQSQRGDDLRVECGILLTAQADQEGQLKMFEDDIIEPIIKAIWEAKRDWKVISRIHVTNDCYLKIKAYAPMMMDFSIQTPEQDEFNGYVLEVHYEPCEKEWWLEFEKPMIKETYRWIPDK